MYASRFTVEPIIVESIINSMYLPLSLRFTYSEPLLLSEIREIERRTNGLVQVANDPTYAPGQTPSTETDSGRGGLSLNLIVDQARINFLSTIHAVMDFHTDIAYLTQEAA